MIAVGGVLWAQPTRAAGPGQAEPAQATATPTGAPPAKCVVDANKVVAPAGVYAGGELKLTLTARATCIGYPVHWALVLDVSGGLSPAAFQAMKDAAVAIVDAMDLPADPQEQVAIVPFDNAAGALSCPLTNDAARARDCIRRLTQSASNQKDIPAGLRAGLSSLLIGRPVGSSSAEIREILVLFSDGNNSGGCPDVLMAAAEVKSQGILLATACVGASCDIACLRQAASSQRYAFNLDTVMGLVPQVDRVSQGLQRLTVRERLTTSFSYVPDSAQPPPTSGNPADVASWVANMPPPEGITVTYRARAPLVPGQYLAGAADVEVRDRAGGVSAVPMPVPLINVLAAPPAPAAAEAQAFLPALAFPTTALPCTAQATVQNLGAEFSKAILVLWGRPDEAAGCEAPCPGPIKVECSGLIKPGASWVFQPNQLPAGAASAMVYHVTAKTLRDIGANLGFDDVTADYVCEKLFFEAVGDCPRFAAFRQAWDGGGTWNGVPLDKAAAGRLAVDVRRTCPTSSGDTVPVGQAGYTAVPGDRLGAVTPSSGLFTYGLPLLGRSAPPGTSLVAAQNAGAECATVDMWLRSMDDCAGELFHCGTVTVQPGTSRVLPACGGPHQQGVGLVTSSQPLAITVDTAGMGVLTTYRGLSWPTSTAAGATLWAPLTLSEYNGWNSRVFVQNTSAAAQAKVKVFFLDRSGDVITTLTETICPLGGAIFDLKAVAGLPGSWVGSVRVESQVWWSPSDPPVGGAPQLVGAITIYQGNDTRTYQSATYELIPGFPAELAGSSMDPVGTTMLTVPYLERTAAEGGPSTELAVLNKVGKPGFTDFAIFLFDQNGLIDYTCQKVLDRQVVHLDLDQWGYVNRGFRGSALVSAAYWEHEVYSPDGQLLYNMVDLAATTLRRDRAAEPALDGASASLAPALARGGALPPVPRNACATRPPYWPTTAPGPSPTGPAPTATPTGIAGSPTARPTGATGVPTAQPPTATARPTSASATATRPVPRHTLYLPLAHKAGGPDATSTPAISPAPTGMATATPGIATATPAPSFTPGPPVPPVNGPGPVFVPALAAGRGVEPCAGRLVVQNLGAEPSKAVLVTWAGAGWCPPHCNGPARVECGGLIRPGGSWAFAASQSPADAQSGAVYGFSARRASELGLSLPGGDDVVADYFCEQLFFGSVGDCAEYRRFQLAYQTGANYADVPLNRAWGGLLVAQVWRDCPGDRTPGLSAAASYTGVNARDRGHYDPSYGGYQYNVPGVVTDLGGLNTRLFVQNAGLDCATLELWYRPESDCLRARICESVSLASGEATRLEARDCVGAGWTGSAWLRASEPLVIVAEQVGQDTLSGAAALAPRAYGDLAGRNELRWLAPLVYGADTGWETRLTVQNVGAAASARVRVQVRDATGQVVETLTDWVCGRGSRTFLVGAGLTGAGPLSVVVESEPYSTGPDTPPAKPEPIAGRVQMLWHGDGSDSPVRRAAAYNLVSSSQLDALVHAPRGGALALPALGRPTDARLPRSSVVLANLVEPGVGGSTGYQLTLFDENGPVARLCGQLPAGQRRDVDLAELPASLPANFRGAGLVSATWWDHGGPRNSPSADCQLAALAVQTGPAQAADPGGPEPLAIEPAALVPGPLPAAGLPCTPLGW